MFEKLWYLKIIFGIISMMLRNLFQQVRNFSVDGFGRVNVGRGLEKLVKNLRVGDEVMTPQGKARIVNINKKDVMNGFYEMVEFNKMLITQDHEIMIYDEWTLPKDVKKVEFVKCVSLYDFELDNYKIMTVNGNNIRTK